MIDKGMTVYVRIQIAEQIDSQWTGWLHGLTIAAGPCGGSRLAGALPDRAALHGLLDRIHDLNLSLTWLQVSAEPFEGDFES